MPVLARVWTIQRRVVWQRLRCEKALYVDEQYVCTPPAYRWLRSQLRRRLPNYTGHLPWWAYCEKPDLRRHRHVLPQSTVHVRLEIEVEESYLLRFPCWAWTRVLCGDYLAATLAEYREYYKQLQRAGYTAESWPPPEPWRSQLYHSWEKLFDASLPRRDWSGNCLAGRGAQTVAVFEVLRLDAVRQVTIFQGAAGWLKWVNGRPVLNTDVVRRKLSR